MNKFFIGILLVFIIGCANYKSKSYRKELKLVHTEDDLKYKYYSKLRKHHLPTVDSLKKHHPNDTILMVEIEQSDDCLCAFREIQLNVNNLYLIKKDYNKPFVVLNDSVVRKSKIFKFKELLKTKENIKINEFDLSSGCSGCGYEHYTAILPNKKVLYGGVYELGFESEIIEKRKDDINETMEFYKISQDEAIKLLKELNAY